jgi:hypothetical protein
MLRAIGIPKSPRAEAAEERGFGEKNYLSIGIGFQGRQGTGALQGFSKHWPIAAWRVVPCSRHRCGAFG